MVLKNAIKMTRLPFGKKIKLDLYLTPCTIPNESEIQVKVDPYENQTNIYMHM